MRTTRGTRLLGTVALAVAAAFAFTGCASTTPADDALPEMVFATTIGKNEPMLIAQEHGLFEKHGVKVKFKNFSSGQEAGQAVLSGEAQMAQVGEAPLLRLNESQPGSVVLVSPFAWDSELYVGVAAKSIKSASDLVGKRVATIVGGSTEFLLNTYLEAGGVSSDEVETVNMSAPDMPVALDRGEIDAFFVWEPFGLQSKELSGDKVHVLTTAENLLRMHLALVSNGEWAEENPETVTNFLAATAEAITYTQENQDEAAQLFATAYGSKLDMAKYNIERTNFSLEADEEFRNDLVRVYEFLAESGLSEGEFDADGTLTNFGPLRSFDESLVADVWK